MDYTLVPAAAYQLLQAWYPGGPDFPRRVVEFGHQRETRVEVYPYFLYYTCADTPLHRGTARERQKGWVVLDSNTQAEEAVRKLFQAVGLSEDRAELWLVPLAARDVEGSKVAPVGSSASEEGPTEKLAKIDKT